VALSALQNAHTSSAPSIGLMLFEKGSRAFLRRPQIAPSSATDVPLPDPDTLLRMAAAMTRVGGWAVELAGLQMQWSEAVCLIHEVPPGYRCTFEESLAFCAAEHRERFKAAFESCARLGMPFDQDLEIVTAHHRRVWVRVIGEAVRDAQGRILRVEGALQDITENHKAAERQQQEALRLNAELHDQVRQCTDELQEAHRDLEAFSYSVAHDLRAPLSAITGYTQALQGGPAAVGDRGQHYLARIEAGARQMHQVTEGLLALARLSHVDMWPQEVDFGEICHDTMAALRQQGPARRVELKVATDLRFEGDPAMLAQLAAQLLGNAWKFSANQSVARIEVGVADQANGERALFVRDNGVGFDLAEAHGLFQAFNRFHGANEFEGAGVGLAIAHKIVARHGGRIWAESAAAKGACFYFTLKQGL
jgi:PAS domain S-box-containing protein